MGGKVETANTEDGGPPPAREGWRSMPVWVGGCSQPASHRASLSLSAPGRLSFSSRKREGPDRIREPFPKEREEESERDSNLERGLSPSLPLSLFQSGQRYCYGRETAAATAARRQLYGSERRQPVPPSFRRLSVSGRVCQPSSQGD